MAGYSARQSTFTTGDTILAAHSNDEFNQVLAAFNATTGHTHDGTAGEGGPIKSLRDANSYNKIAIDDSNNHLEFSVNVSNNSVEQVKIQDGAIVPVTDDDIDLGTSSLEFKNAFFDGTVEADAITVGGTNITSLFAGLSGNTFTGNIEIDVASGDPTIILDTQGADKFHIAVDDSDSDNLVVKSGGTVGSGSGLKLDSSGNLIVDGDLTVSGDDITMGTNTAGNLLIADGTNFNSIAVGSLSEISTVASDDILLAVDTSGGGLKKITRSTLTAGIATGSEISNIVEDTTPQLGGNLDMNGQDIVTTSNANIELAANGTGHVVVKGNIDNVMLLPKDGDSTLVSEISTQTLTNKTLTTPVINAGAQLKNGSTSAGFLEFFEDSDNGTNKVTLIGPASTSDITLTLPATAGTLVGTGDSGTLPLAAIDIDGGTDIGADLTTSDLIVVDDGAGGTNRKAALSRVVTLMTAQGFTTDDPTALAIALG